LGTIDFERYENIEKLIDRYTPMWSVNGDWLTKEVPTKYLEKMEN